MRQNEVTWPLLEVWEKEIRDAAESLRHLRMTEILALYSRLSAAEQDRVFTGHLGRRIVLATNVAETSVTVPGVRYVIDTGLARINRFNPNTKVQRLLTERISQASAEHRKGRCGRLSAGISYLVQITTLITFIVSSYVIVLRYPTPIAVSDRLRRD